MTISVQKRTKKGGKRTAPPLIQDSIFFSKKFPRARHYSGSEIQASRLPSVLLCVLARSTREQRPGFLDYRECEESESRGIVTVIEEKYRSIPEKATRSLMSPTYKASCKHVHTQKISKYLFKVSNFSLKNFLVHSCTFDRWLTFPRNPAFLGWIFLYLTPSTLLFLPKQKERTKENRVQRVLYIEFYLMERVVLCSEMKWNEME